MKKLVSILIATTLFFIFSPLSAQEKFGLGVKTGINIANQTTSGTIEEINVNGILRFNAGVYCNFFALDKLAIQPELLLSGKGADWSDPNFEDITDLLTYLDLPVLVRYQPLDFLNVHAGPQFGYLLSALQKDNVSGNKEKINEYYKKADLGLVIGAEANLPFRINLTVRYVFGLIAASVESSDPYDPLYIEPWKNNFLQISAGFRIKGK